MARVVLAKSGIRREFFVIDQAVGTGLPNAEQDVLLVQFFLRVASLTVGQFAGFQPPGEQPIGIDGKFGRQTQTYISFYQQEVNRRVKRKLLEPDGRIDPMRPGQTTSSITNTFFTILDLNVAYRSRRGDNTRLETDALFPQALGKSFFF
jgi:hypothetical protein